MRFAYSLDMEVPYGRYMLATLLNHGHIPEIVIEEDSPRATEHRNIFLERLRGKELPPLIATQVKEHSLKYARVPKLSAPECERILRIESPDLMVSGGTFSLLKRSVFSIPRWGTLVAHPGLLPYVRGAASPAWSIYKDIRIGCSCIVIDEGIDTGPIIKSKLVPVYDGDNYSDVVERNVIYCGELMAEVVAMFKETKGPIKGEQQDLSVGETFRVMPPELVEIVKEKLASGTYRWMQRRNP